MNRIEVIRRLKDVLPKTEAGFVDIFLKRLRLNRVRLRGWWF